MNGQSGCRVACICVLAVCGCDHGGRTAPPAKGTDSTNAVTADPPGVAAPPERKVEVKETRWPSGALASRIEGYMDDEGGFVKHGVAAEWYENDRPKLEIHWRDGVQHGPRLTWYDSGQMWGQGAYINGREDGLWTAWSRSGFKSSEWTMSNGAFHGMYTEWHPNGEKRRQFEYINGQKQGPVTYWDDEGNVVSQGEYVNDVLQP